MIRVVLDTNIFVSSVFWEKGNPHKIIEKTLEGQVTVFVSKEILEELEKVLKRDFQEHDEFIGEQISFIKGYAEIVEVKEGVNAVQEDPDDNKIIECALAAQADYIISGDNHLLKLKEYEGIKIRTPKEFLSIISKEI